jgi:hypothetical protein
MEGEPPLKDPTQRRDDRRIEVVRRSLMEHFDGLER